MTMRFVFVLLEMSGRQAHRSYAWPKRGSATLIAVAKEVNRLPCLPQLAIHLADDPALCAWKGGAVLAASPQYSQLAVTRHEWRQHGLAALAKWGS